MSQFIFLEHEWPAVFDSAARAEVTAYSDPRTACFYARRALELAVNWAYKHDAALRLPYQDNLSALIHEPTFKRAVGAAIFSKAKIIKDLGNQAIHSTRAVRQLDAVTAVRELFHIGFWLARTYARAGKPADGLAFDPQLLPKTSPVPQQTLAQLQRWRRRSRRRTRSSPPLLSDKAALDDELKRLRAEVADGEAGRDAAQPDTHDYSEAETRDYFIDLLLQRGRLAARPSRDDREFEVTGMPNNEGEGFVDYVLWGDDGKPLGLVEAKRTKRDRARRPAAGQALRRLPGDAVRPAAGDLLHQRLRALDLGRRAATRRARCRASTRRTSWSC